MQKNWQAVTHNAPFADKVPLPPAFLTAFIEVLDSCGLRATVWFFGPRERIWRRRWRGHGAAPVSRMFAFGH
jgi:hypothetical protein